MNNKLHISGCTISSYQCKCFEKLTTEQIKLLEDNSVMVKYKKKETFCKRGSLVSHIMYMEDGLGKVFIENESNTLVLKIIPAKNFIGLASVSEEQNMYQYSASAYVDSVVRQIDLGVFRSLLTQNAEFAKEVIDILTANSTQIYGRFFCLTHKQSYGKLADIILCLSERIFKSDEFDLPLSRKDLAELSGMSEETVIRLLKAFREDQLIAMTGKKFRILNFEKLLQISENG